MTIEPADAAWIGLYGVALAIDRQLDVHGRPLLSHRPVGWALTALLAAHLAGLLPDRADPFRLLLRR